MNKTIIFRITAPNKDLGLKAAAASCVSLFDAKLKIPAVDYTEKAGAEPIKRVVEETFGLCNTPVQNGYVRVIADDKFLLEASKTLVGYKPYMELVRIEPDGQTEFVVNEYDDPDTKVHVRELLGYIAGLPILSETVKEEVADEKIISIK